MPVGESGSIFSESIAGEIYPRHLFPFAVVGFSSFFAFFLFGLFGTGFLDTNCFHAPSWAFPFNRFLAFSSLVLVHCLLKRNWPRLRNYEKPMIYSQVLVAGLVSVVAFCSQWLSFPLVVYSVAFFLYGAGIAVAEGFWYRIFTPTWRSDVSAYVTLSFLFGAIIFLFANALPAGYGAAALVVLSVCSAACALFFVKHMRGYSFNDTKPIDKDLEKALFPLSSTICILVLSATLSFATCVPIAGTITFDNLFPIAAVLGAVVYLIETIRKKAYIPLGSLRNQVAVIATLAIISSLFLPKSLETIPAVLLQALFSFFCVAKCATSIALASSHPESSAYVYHHTRISYCIGTAAGFLLYALLDLFSNATVINTEICLTAFAALCIATIPFIPFRENNVTDSLGGSTRSSGSVSTEEIVQDISQEYGLSNRESEVLYLLARGYNTRTISDALFISQSTAKTHVAHIHKKLDISSKQDLVAIIENRRLL